MDLAHVRTFRRFVEPWHLRRQSASWMYARLRRGDGADFAHEFKNVHELFGKFFSQNK